jgi:hypothetical protein
MGYSADIIRESEARRIHVIFFSFKGKLLRRGLVLDGDDVDKSFDCLACPFLDNSDMNFLFSFLCHLDGGYLDKLPAGVFDN